MAHLPYSVSATFTNGSAVVSASLALFAANVLPGDWVRGPDDKIYFVTSVDSQTQITLDRNYLGTTATATVLFAKHSDGWGSVADANSRLARIEEALALGYKLTSASSLAIGAGAKAFTVEAGLPISDGIYMRATSRSNPDRWMQGTCTYAGNALTMTVAAGDFSSSGTYADWNINIAGTRGAAGANGTTFTAPATTVVGRLLKYANILGTQLAQTLGLIEDGSGNVGINETSPTGKLDVRGAIRCEAQTNVFGLTNSFGALVIGKKDGADAGNGGLMAFNRFVKSNEGFVGLSGWDGGASRVLYFGGGGWGAPDATHNYFYTAPTYDETNNSGIMRLRINPDGAIWPGADNAQSFGSSGLRWSAIYAANGTIQTSDARDKIHVGDLEHASEIIDRVDAKLFRWRVGRNDVSASPDETEIGEDGRERRKTIVTPRPGKRVHAGFFAQDVKAALDAVGADFSAWGLDDASDPDSRQWLRPDQLIPVLWAALKETRAEVAALKAAIEK